MDADITKHGFNSAFSSDTKKISCHIQPPLLQEMISSFKVPICSAR